jgi:polar amino acid transport system substrate-binding protein
VSQLATPPQAPAPRPSRGSVDIRRPAVYLAVAAVLALGTALLPGDTGPAAAAPPSGGGPAPSSTAPACTQVQDSLRPQGPLPPAGKMPAGTAMAAIQQRGRLIVGVDQSKYLVGYRNPLSGELEGTDIDIVHQVAQAIFGDPNRVQFVVYDVADRAKAVQTKQVDMVVNSFSITCARQQTVEFSSVYQTASQRLMVPKGSGIKEVEDLKDAKVCTSAGSITVKKLQDLGANVVTEPGIPDCVIDLQLGQVAAVSTDDIILAGLSAQDPQTEVVGRALDTTGYGIGMSKDTPDLVRFVNGVLDKARADGSLQDSYTTWLGEVLKPAPTPPPAKYRD